VSRSAWRCPKSASGGWEESGAGTHVVGVAPAAYALKRRTTRAPARGQHDASRGGAHKGAMRGEDDSDSLRAQRRRASDDQMQRGNNDDTERPTTLKQRLRRLHQQYIIKTHNDFSFEGAAVIGVVRVVQAPPCPTCRAGGTASRHVQAGSMRSAGATSFGAREGVRGWHGIGLGIEVEIGVWGCAGVGGGEGGRGCRGCLEGVGERSLALLLAKGRVGGKIKERDLLRPTLGARKGPSLAPNAGQQRLVTKKQVCEGEGRQQGVPRSCGKNRCCCIWSRGEGGVSVSRAL
jgi:hypothetical protein